MIYAVSDLHGYPLEEFQRLLDKAGFSDNDFCFVLGDVIDRGSDGIKILRWLMKQSNFELIRGNHEDMMLSCDFLFNTVTEEAIYNLTGTDFNRYSSWLANGAQPTVDALTVLRNSEREYLLEFLNDTPLYDTVSIGEKDFILTHSGLGSFDKNKKLSEYSKHDLIWTRPNLNARYFDNIMTVFGHTPTVYYGDEYKGRAIITETWADIDAGAACGFKPMLLRLDDMKEFYLD